MTKRTIVHTETAPLWEILVPTVSNDGKPFRTRHHREWDRRVREIAGGLTIFKPAKGQWISRSGRLFVERMIPVKIMCTEEQIIKIADILANHYSQEAVMVYPVSSNAMVLHYHITSSHHKFV